MKICAVNAFSKSAYKNNSKVAFGKNSDVNSATYDISREKRVVQAKFDPDKKILTVHSAVKSAFDSDVWYQIKEDGSGMYSTCWHPKAIRYDEGMLKGVYEIAKAIYEDNGSISKESSDIIMEQIKKVTV